MKTARAPTPLSAWRATICRTRVASCLATICSPAGGIRDGSAHRGLGSPGHHQEEETACG
jgi:hypothetical protein